MTLNTSSAHLSQSSNKSGSDFVLVSDFWFMFGSSACFYDNIRAMCALGPNPVWLSLTSMPWVRNVKWHFFQFCYMIISNYSLFVYNQYFHNQVKLICHNKKKVRQVAVCLFAKIGEVPHSNSHCSNWWWFYLIYRKDV